MNIIASKDNLLRSALCNNHIETVDHLFIECKTTKKVWNLSHNWINIIIVPPNKLTQHFHQFNILGIRQHGNKIWKTNWMTTMRKYERIETSNIECCS